MVEPHRVLLVGAASSIHTARWANALAARGLDVHLASAQPPRDQTYLDAVIRHPIPMVGRMAYFAAIPALRVLVQRLRPDLINTHYASGYGTLSSLALVGSRVPHLLSVWGSDVYEFPDTSPLHRAMIARNLRRATLVASTSYSMAERVRDLMGPCEVAITPFGVDLNRFPMRPPSGGSTVRIGAAKALEPHYGIDTLIEAFALLPRSLVSDGRGVRLVLIGEGSQRPVLKALATNLGVSDQVDFVGQVPHAQMPAALAELDVLANLSRSESFGVSILEASATGLPVVVSDASGPAEVTVDQVTGFVVPREDPAAAAAALAELIEDADLRAQMGAAGRAHVEAEYSWQASVEAMLDAYRRTLELGRSA